MQQRANGPATDGPWVQVVAGAAHTCGPTDAGVAYCWGRNSYGQLGTGRHRHLLSEPAAVVCAPLFQSQTVGGSHQCGLTSDGIAYSWGSGVESVLGRTLPRTYATSPVEVIAP